MRFELLMVLRNQFSIKLNDFLFLFIYGHKPNRNCVFNKI